MKTIVVPVKFGSSRASDRTLLYALDLARAANLHVVVFHAFSPEVSSPELYEDPSVILTLERGKAQELEAYVNKTKEACSTELILKFKRTDGAVDKEQVQLPVTRSGNHTLAERNDIKPCKPVRITCVCKLGETYEQIMSVAFAYNADLLVMGIQGKGAKNQSILESLTLMVMRNSHVPVLGIPKNIRFSRLKKVVFASNLVKAPETGMLSNLRKFIATFKLKLLVLHLCACNDQQEEYSKAQTAIEALDTQLHDVNFSIFFKLRQGLDNGIQEFILEHRADMLILSPYRHTFAEKFLNKSLTQRMLNKTYVPLLALPTKVKQPSTENQAVFTARKTDPA